MDTERNTLEEIEKSHCPICEEDRYIICSYI